MAATTTLSNVATNGSYEYTDTGVAMSGTFSASGTTIQSIVGEDQTLGKFTAVIEDDNLAYILEPAAIANADDLATAAAAVVAAVAAKL